MITTKDILFVIVCMHFRNIDKLLIENIMIKNYNLKPYTVYYRNFRNIRLVNCFYAYDAFEAKALAMEFNKYIKEHPNSIDLIKCEY